MSKIITWWNNQSIAIRLTLGLLLGVLFLQIALMVNKIHGVKEEILMNYQRQAITLSFAVDCIVLKDYELLFNLLERINDSKIKEILIEENHPSCLDRTRYLERLKTEYFQAPAEEVEEIEAVEEIEEVEAVEEIEEIVLSENESQEEALPESPSSPQPLTNQIEGLEGNLRAYDLDVAGKTIHQIDYTVKANGVTLIFDLKDLPEQIRQSRYDYLLQTAPWFAVYLLLALLVVAFIFQNFKKPMKNRVDGSLTQKGKPTETKALASVPNPPPEAEPVTGDFRVMSDFLKTLFIDLKSANQELQEHGESLEHALEELTENQIQLVQSEKMAALEQLIDGVSHEINTPLGAIQASNDIIDEALKTTYAHLPALLQTLSSEQLTLFFSLLLHSIEQQPPITSRQERQFRRNLTSKLTEMQVENAHSVASRLVQMGIYENVERFFPLLKKFDPQAFQLLQDLASLQKSNKTIYVAVERATGIIIALKKFVHQDISGQPIAFDLNDNIDTVLILYGSQLRQGIQLKKLFGVIPLVVGHPDQLSQVWANLLQNAIQAMNYQGNLEFQTQSSHGQVVVEITDSGTGIAEDIQNQVFEPFFTTKPTEKSKGLGLDICQKIIENHQGTIVFESVPGKTTFRVTLPIQSNQLGSELCPNL